MRNKPDQISGFRIPLDQHQQLHSRFADALRVSEPEIFKTAAEDCSGERHVTGQNLWDKVVRGTNESPNNQASGPGFTFGFEAESDEEL